MTVLVVDTSAVVALLKSEPGWETLASRLHAAAFRLLSVVGWVELSLVVAGRHGDAATLAFLDRFLQTAAIERRPVDEPQARLARDMRHALVDESEDALRRARGDRRIILIEPEGHASVRARRRNAQDGEVDLHARERTGEAAVGPGQIAQPP